MGGSITIAEQYRIFTNSPALQTAKYFFDNLLEADFKKIQDCIREIKTRKTPSKSHKEYYASNDIDWFKPSDIGGSIYLANAKEKVSKKALQENKITYFKEKTLLITCIGDIGRIGILGKDATANQQITGVLFDDTVLPEYAFLYLASHRNSFIDSGVLKTTLPIINQNKLKNLAIKVPCIELQKSVVEYFFKFIKYGKPDKDSKGLNSYLKPIERFGKVVRSSNGIGNSLITELTHQQDLLDKLRQAILQEAIEGKLTAEWRAQNPVVEPAADLLARIRAEKAQLVEVKKIRKQKPLPPIIDDEIPFALPEGWVWCRLGELAGISSGKGFKKSEYSEDGVKLFQIANVGFGETLWDKIVYLPKAYLRDYPSLELHEGDLVMALNRPLLGKKLKVARLTSKDVPAILYQRVGRFDFIETKIMSWVFLYLRSTEFSDWLYNQIKGVNIPFVNQTKVYRHIIPLPPLAEQQAIVAKVESLLAGVEQLQEQNHSAQEQAGQLMQSVLKEAFQQKWQSISGRGNDSYPSRVESRKF